MSRLCLNFGVALASAAMAQDGPDPVERSHEMGDHGLYIALPSERSGAARVVLNEFTSIQVNVDENGQNVVGDAANEPSLAVDPTAPNRIVVGWRQFDSIKSDFRQAGFSYSDDGGRTWAPMGVIEPGVFRSDPVLQTDRHGLIYFLSLTRDGGALSTDLFVSRDGGESFPEKHFAFGGDKQWFTIDRTGGPSDGVIYQTWIDQFNRSFKRGAAWQEPTAFTDVGGGWGTIEVDAAGDALIVGENGQDGISLYRSADAREEDVIEPTFVETTVLDEGVWTFGSCRPNRAGAVSQIEIALDRSNGPRQGNIYVLAAVQHWRVFGGTDWSSLVLLRSSDGGTTWSEPVRINDDDPSGDDDWRWLGTFDVAPNGRIDVVWNDTRNNPDRFARFSETYYAFSTDGGATFSDNVPIGPEWNSHIGWPQQEKIGDYYDLVSDDVGAHLVYATTYNGEQDVYYLRIGDYDCNANGVGDAIDITNGDARDCNANGIPDSCEIATGAEIDDDGNGVPDRCECAADLDRDLDIDSDDFFIYLDLFAADDTAADLDGDGDIDGDDFAHFIDGFEAGCP